MWSFKKSWYIKWKESKYEKIIRVTNLVKNYRNIESVKGINLDVNQGDLSEVFLNMPEHVITDYSAN